MNWNTNPESKWSKWVSDAGKRQNTWDNDNGGARRNEKRPQWCLPGSVQHGTSVSGMCEIQEHTDRCPKNIPQNDLTYLVSPCLKEN